MIDPKMASFETNPRESDSQRFSTGYQRIPGDAPPASGRS